LKSPKGDQNQGAQSANAMADSELVGGVTGLLGVPLSAPDAQPGLGENTVLLLQIRKVGFAQRPMRKMISYTINSVWRTNDKLFMFPHSAR